MIIRSDGAGKNTFTNADVRAVFLRWEKLRLLYNLIVGLVGAAGAAACVLDLAGLFNDPHDAMPLQVLVIGVVCYGIAANVCYFLGPILESYLRWVGLRAPRLTQTLFITGTVFSVLLTALIGLVMWAVALWPPFD